MRRKKICGKKEEEIYPSELFIAAFVQNRGACTIEEIARCNMLSEEDVKEILRKLEKEEYVEKDRHGYYK